MTMNKMKLESLSNELFIDLFELLNAVDLLRAFHGLNTRFDYLLFKHFRTYRVDFRSISKEDFNIVYRAYLPLIINRIIYLRLSDDEDTPYQCAHFLYTGFTLDRFENLRSLTFNCVSSDPNINQFFFSNLHRLHHLTHLKFVDCRLFHVNSNDFQDVINQIWKLPKLTHCYLEFNFKAETYFCIPTFVSTSLQYLTIRKSDWSSNEFAHLLEKTPRLRKFSMSSDSCENYGHIPSHDFIPSSQNLSVKKLVLFGIRSQCVMINLLQLLPHVNHLKVEIFYINLDGYRWEQIIDNYLPQLKVLQFKMDLNFSHSIDEQNNAEKVEQYLATYRTPFWIEHHQWFIRCHWGLWMERLLIRVYSLPYAFDYFPILYNESNLNTKSTSSREMHFSYDSVRSVAYDPSFFNDDVLSRIQLINTEILYLQFPIDHRFLSIIPNFEKFLALNVIIYTRNYQSQLQSLLDSAPHLYSLAFESWNTSTMPPYQYTSTSIRRLNLGRVDQSRRRHGYDRKQCMDLSRSPLGIQCRVLIIKLEESGNIIELINSMTNLRTLDVSYEGDKRGNTYDLVELLQYRLPSQWTVTRRSYGNFIIQS